MKVNINNEPSWSDENIVVRKTKDCFEWSIARNSWRKIPPYLFYALLMFHEDADYPTIKKD